MSNLDEAFEPLDEAMREIVALAIQASLARKTGETVIGGQVSSTEYAHSRPESIDE
jgi:hypothetical protein